MTEQSADNREFGTNYSREALRGRKSLPMPARRALTDLEDELFEDATEFLARSRPDPKDPTVLLYTMTNPPLVVAYKLDRERRAILILHVAAPEFEEKKPLFISYKHGDEEWLESLLKWLTGIDRGLISVWNDQKIEAGTRWRDEIFAALRSAKAAVLLVTQDFLASEFISDDELPALLEGYKEGRLKLLWIAVRPSRYDLTPLADLQALNDPKKPLYSLRGPNRDNAYREISERIERAVASGPA